MAWRGLFVLTCFEAVWAFALKLSEGVTRPVASLVLRVFACVGGCGPMVPAYLRLAWPIRLGARQGRSSGAIGAFLLGAMQLGKALTALRLRCVGLVPLGRSGLKLVSAGGLIPAELAKAAGASVHDIFQLEQST